MPRGGRVKTCLPAISRRGEVRKTRHREVRQRVRSELVGQLHRPWGEHNITTLVVHNNTLLGSSSLEMACGQWTVPQQLLMGKTDSHHQADGCSGPASHSSGHASHPSCRRGEPTLRRHLPHLHPTLMFKGMQQLTLHLHESNPHCQTSNCNHASCGHTLLPCC
ncbi:hypothetical protein HaLaN_10555 [Haematococcus lacustris]|uniref:Uncharacterized protein n=1 Tax=Haematococcus lacustris TaxID=44745 RepID=A0A699YXY9_HAELA|nr:hypothetical protein HaLaN_10555 [Haematococcus lacustris]